jgi:archaellum component FlaF (FlaF/FlaG flagellin family)
MEVENKAGLQNEPPRNGKKKMKGLKIFSILILLIVILVFGYFAYFAIQSPFIKAAEFQGKYRPDVENSTDSIRKSIEILSLENEIAFQNTDINLTKNDSIYLIIDFVDSMIFMELKGISLFETKMVDFSVSKFLNKLDPKILNNYISKPFKIENTVSTIEKMVLKTKIAPKNEEEAFAQFQADTVKAEKDYVRYTWYFDRDLEIEIVQDSLKREAYKLKDRDILLKRKIGYLKEVVDSAIDFHTTTYTPSIKIVLHQNDARTIFRSMPYNGMVALRLGFEGMQAVKVE